MSKAASERGSCQLSHECECQQKSQFSLTWRQRALTIHLVAFPLFLGQVEYNHGAGNPSGNFPFKFDVVDGKGNQLMGQSFSIKVSGKED